MTEIGLEAHADNDRVLAPRSLQAATVGALIAVAGTAVAAWISLGRTLFDRGGSLVLVYAFTLGLLFVILNVFTGLAIARARQRGHRVRPRTWLCIAASWVLGMLLGLLLPDITAEGLQTVVSGPTEPMLGIAIGFANPVGIFSIGITITALVLARLDARGPRPVDEND